MSRLPLLFVASSLAIATSACPDQPPDGAGGSGGSGGSGGAPSPCAAGFIGDPDLAPEIQVFFYGADDDDHPVVDGSRPSLVEPPQGGRVLYIGARARNIDSCNVLLTGTLRDPTSNQIRFDGRSVSLVPDSDGWGSIRRGDFSVYANVPACQNSWSALSVHEDTYQLEVRLTDPGGRVAETSFDVRPECSEYSQARPSGPEVFDECLCICRAGYTIGDTCEGGAGGSGSGGSGSGGSGRSGSGGSGSGGEAP